MLKITDPMPDAPTIMWQGTFGTRECLHINLPHLNKLYFMCVFTCLEDFSLGHIPLGAVCWRNMDVLANHRAPSEVAIFLYCCHILKQLIIFDIVAIIGLNKKE